MSSIYVSVGNNGVCGCLSAVAVRIYRRPMCPWSSSGTRGRKGKVARFGLAEMVRVMPGNLIGSMQVVTTAQVLH